MSKRADSAAFDRAEGSRGDALRVYFNGKFYSGPINGVHRVADRLLTQLDAMAGEGAAPAGWDMRLLVPAADNWAPEFAHIRKVAQPRGHTQLWEQAVLPFVARGGVLVSLANFAPSLHRRKVTMVHDAQFLISPQSYTRRRRLGYRLLIPIGARTSRTVLTVSHFARDSLESFGFAKRERIAVVHNAAEHIREVVADAAIIDRLALREGRYCVVFGSIATYKNVQVVFDAFARAELAGLQLVVIGPDAQTLRRRGLTPPQDAVFTGGVDDRALRALYESALCLLFPSRTEGFGLPPLEAMTCGCPVIAAPAGAVPEVCRDAVLYADTSDPQSWAAAMLRLTSEPALREAKIAAGLARAADFSWRRSAERVAEAITAALRTPG